MGSRFFGFDLLGFGPRRLERRPCLRLAGQLGIGQPFADDLGERLAEAFAIVT